MSRWSDSSTWVGDGLRREVFFFRSCGVELYGSLYAAAEPTRPFGLVACASWGVEADRTDPLQRSVALAMAELGGAGLVFHYPGYGDSFGELAGLGLADLSTAANDAVEQASRRCPGLAWILAGFMLGASVACLAQLRTAAAMLLLVQPELRPAAYFEKLTKRGRPLPLPQGSVTGEMMEAGAAADMAYGYSVPRRIIERGPEGDAEVAAALAEFPGDGAVVRYERPPLAGALPGRLEQIAVSGAWRFGSQSDPGLNAAAVDWLDRRTRGGDER